MSEVAGLRDAHTGSGRALGRGVRVQKDGHTERRLTIGEQLGRLADAVGRQRAWVHGNGVEAWRHALQHLRDVAREHIELFQQVRPGGQSPRNVI